MTCQIITKRTKKQKKIDTHIYQNKRERTYLPLSFLLESRIKCVKYLDELEDYLSCNSHVRSFLKLCMYFIINICTMWMYKLLVFLFL